MDTKQSYLAEFWLNDKIVDKILDDNKEKLIARAMVLLESTHKGAVCEIKNTNSQKLIQTLKRSSPE